MGNAIYAGTFDPLTFGHLDIIKRAAAVYDKLIVSTTDNPRKDEFFRLDERVRQLKAVTSDIANVEVKPFHGLLVDFARETGVNVLVRGLRAASDFEYEFQMAMMNRNLASEIETVFFITSPQFMFVSSSLIREIAKAGGQVGQFVPNSIRDDIIAKLGR